MYYSWNHTLNVLANLMVAATLLSCLMSSLTNACGSKGTSGATVTTPDPGPRGRQMFRFRRGPEVIDTDEEEESTLISTPVAAMMDKLDHVLDNFEEDVSVIEWAREGNSVNDFWKLLDIYDKDGNDLISRTEVAQVHKELSKEHPLNTS